MGFELSPSAWGHLWSILGLNISYSNLLRLSLSKLFESENHLFRSVALELFEKKLKPWQIAIIRMKMQLNRVSIAEKTICW